ncbi:MAG: hypothetical protein E4H20_11310, partial [Spirochaetales bacterium]
MRPTSRTILAASISNAFGFDGRTPLGGGTLPLPLLTGRSDEETKSIDFLNDLFSLLADGKMEQAGTLCERWSEAAGYLFQQAVDACDLAWARIDDGGLSTLLATLAAEDRISAASALARLWAPEIAADRERTTNTWKLNSVQANGEPIRPEQVLIQLNGLYTLPDRIPDGLPPGLAAMGRNVLENPGNKVADYDHPVPLFEADDVHELVSCLAMLERDLAYEKSIGTLPERHRVPVVLSVSVTHEGLDGPVSTWIRHLLERKDFRNFRLYLLTEEACRRIDRELFRDSMPQFGVSGAYGRHFTALKYTGL